MTGAEIRILTAADCHLYPFTLSNDVRREEKSAAACEVGDLGPSIKLMGNSISSIFSFIFSSVARGITSRVDF